MTTWFRVGFDDAITHAVSLALVAPLVADMAQRGHHIADLEKKYGREHAKALGGNPVAITEWALDIGGPVHINEPRETFNVDGLSLVVACDHFCAVQSELAGLPIRQFDGGETYVKAKFWMHATVLTPLQRDLLVAGLFAGRAAATARHEAFRSEIESQIARRREEAVSRR